MSLETALQENTATMQALIQALTNVTLNPAPTVNAEQTEVKKETKKESSKKQEGTTAAIDIAELRKTAQQHLLQLCKNGKREQAVELLKSFNADKLGDLQDTDVSAFIKGVEALLEG